MNSHLGQTVLKETKKYCYGKCFMNLFMCIAHSSDGTDLCRL